MAAPILPRDPRDVLIYDPETGVYTDRETGEVRSKESRAGYVSVHVGRKSYSAHRLAVLFMTGAMPPRHLQVNHKDHDPANNAWSNLEVVTPSGNALAAVDFYREHPNFQSKPSKYREERLERIAAGLPVTSPPPSTPPPPPSTPPSPPPSAPPVRKAYRKAPRTLDIAKSTHRKRLAARAEPYFRTLAKGRAVGVRIGAKGQTWIARYRKDDGKQEHKALPEAKDYDTAERLARAWFDKLAHGIVTGMTVEDACRRYVQQIETEKGKAQARDAGGRLRRRVFDNPIGRIALEDLRQAHVETWRDNLPGAKASANRDLSALKAALNRSYRGGLIDSDRAWRHVKAFPNTHAPRKRFLDRDERRALLANADGAIADLIEACLHTGARPIEIHRAVVADLDVFTKTLTLVGYKGKTGEARPREVPLSPPALAFFKRMARSKLPAAPLVPRDDGKPWAHSDHDELFRAVRDAAGLPGVTLYAVRHSIIAEWLVSGIDPMTVSKIAGTGMAMLERHYSKFMKKRAAAAIAAVDVL